MFTYVHVINTFLLMSGYLVIFTSFLNNDNIAITLVLLVTAMILLLLPYLEIEEYDLIQEYSKRRMDSKRTHFLFSAIVFAEPSIFIITAYLKKIGGIQNANIVGTFVFVMAFFLAMVWFLNQIGEEVKRYTSTNEAQSDLDQFIS